MTESSWTIVWPEGDEPDYDNSDRYVLLSTRSEAVQYVQDLITSYADSDGTEGAHPANILIFPPNTSLDAATFSD